MSGGWQRRLGRGGGGGPGEAAWAACMKNRREPVASPRVVDQGEPGCYSEEAAGGCFGPEVDSRGLAWFPDVFAALERGDLVALAPRMFNAFEAVLPPHQHRDIGGTEATLRQAGALGAAMGGSGPTVLGLLSQEAAARKAVAVLQEDYDEVYLTHPLPAHGASCQIPV